MSAALATRAAAGLVLSGLANAGPPAYRRLDLIVYSPICLCLAVLGRRVAPR